MFSNGDRIVHIHVLADDNGPVDYMVFGVSGGGLFRAAVPSESVDVRYRRWRRTWGRAPNGRAVNESGF